MSSGLYKKPKIPFTLPDNPSTMPLQPGRYHRVLCDKLNRSYGAESFNPYIGYTIDSTGRLNDSDGKVVAGTRFSPVVSKNGKIIPTLYLASTDRAAYAEILVRAKSQKQITYKQISVLERVTIDLNCSLTMLNMVSPLINDNATNPFSVTEAQLIRSTERYYRETCRFASEAHQKYQNIQGIHWFSRQERNNSVVVLFGDRLNKDCLTHIDSFSAISPEEMQIWAPDAARNKVVPDHDLLQYMHATLPDIGNYSDWRW